MATDPGRFALRSKAERLAVGDLKAAHPGEFAALLAERQREVGFVPLRRRFTAAEKEEREAARKEAREAARAARVAAKRAKLEAELAALDSVPALSEAPDPSEASA